MNQEKSRGYTLEVLIGVIMCALHAVFFFAVLIMSFPVGWIQAMTGLWPHSDPWFVMLWFAIGGIIDVSGVTFPPSFNA